MADVFFLAFVQVVHDHFFFHANFFSFSFVDRQNTYGCKSDLFANFGAFYIFPCTLSGDIPYFLLQSAVADDVGHISCLNVPLCHEDFYSSIFVVFFI